jgi:predicted PurR-regulated permease PerM
VPAIRSGSNLVVPAGLAFTNFVVLAIVVAALTRDILVPIALAVLLSFPLAPLVRLLQRGLSAMTNRQTKKDPG